MVVFNYIEKPKLRKARKMTDYTPTTAEIMYHISEKGNPVICRVKNGTCSQGEYHFNNKQEARDFVKAGKNTVTDNKQETPTNTVKTPTVDTPTVDTAWEEVTVESEIAKLVEYFKNNSEEVLNILWSEGVAFYEEDSGYLEGIIENYDVNNKDHNTVLENCIKNFEGRTTADEIDKLIFISDELKDIEAARAETELGYRSNRGGHVYTNDDLEDAYANKVYKFRSIDDYDY